MAKKISVRQWLQLLVPIWIYGNIYGAEVATNVQLFTPLWFLCLGLSLIMVEISIHAWWSMRDRQVESNKNK